MVLLILDLWFSIILLKYLTEDSTLESNPLMSLSKDRQLKAFVHMVILSLWIHTESI